MNYSDPLNPLDPLNMMDTNNNSSSLDDEPIPFWGKILVFIAALFLLFCLLYMVDLIFLYNRYTNRISYGENKSYIIPKTYKILTNGRFYVVKTSDGEYLYQGRYGLEEMDSSIAHPSEFIDTGNAKAAIKSYLDGKKDKAIDFK